jgi:hypothetical protein
MSEGEALADQIKRMVDQRDEARDKIAEKAGLIQAANAYVTANSQAEWTRLLTIIRREVQSLNDAKTGLPTLKEVGSNGYAVMLGNARATLEPLTPFGDGTRGGVMVTIVRDSAPFMLATKSETGPLYWHDNVGGSWTTEQIVEYVLKRLSQAYLKTQT